MKSPPVQALVSATFSRRMELRLESGDVVPARVKGKRLRCVCGDHVCAEKIPNEPEWLITSVLPRSNELARPNSRGQIEILAANISYLVVVVSDPPTPDWFVVDRYLSAAELMNVDAAVVFNKIDVSALDKSSEDALNEYRQIGYQVVLCSAKTGESLDLVEQLLQDQTAIIVGQSGVGKSSLINKLAIDSDQRTAELSDATGEGRHTTVNSAMLTLRNGGVVIDSPGVRDYAPATMNADDVILGFREIREAGQECRFANCRHLREPDCAVKSAVDNGTISARRYESYKRLQVLTDKLSGERKNGR